MKIAIGRIETKAETVFYLGKRIKRLVKIKKEIML